MAIPMLPGARAKKILAALESNWQAEVEAYHTYLALAESAIPIRCAPRCCVIWPVRSGNTPPSVARPHSPSWVGPSLSIRASLGGEADSLANRAGGVRMALRRLEIEESRHIATYGEQLKALGDEGSVAILDHVIEDEKDHYRELGSLLRGHYTTPAGAPKIDAKAVLAEMLAKRNQGRKQAGSWIGDAIYGVNDGLGAIFGIVSGVSGATLGDPAQTSHYVLLAGLSGMIASALSMGSGAYLAAKSEKEIYAAEVSREREAIQMNGPEARELLSLYYQVKGLPEADAMHMVNHIASDPDQLLRALTQERLGSTEESLSNPMVSALSGALSTAVGAIIPVIPFFLPQWDSSCYRRRHHLPGSALCRGRSQVLITVRSWWSSGFEMTVVGALEGAVTYGIGILLGKGGI